MFITTIRAWAVLLLAGLAGFLVAGSLTPVSAAPATSGGASRGIEPTDCVWGQKGYRDCVDHLLAQSRTLDPEKALRDTANRTRSAAPAPTARRSGRRPGAGSLTPTPPAELRLTPPVYDPAQEAVAAERRQRSLDDNLFRMQRDATTPPIVPAPLNPPNGRICPIGGC